MTAWTDEHRRRPLPPRASTPSSSGPSPYAAFITFDAPTSDTACVRRERSNTPLQALTLLNDTVFVEAAQALARRILRERPGPPPTTDSPRLPPLPGAAPAAGGSGPDHGLPDHQLARFRPAELDAARVAGDGGRSRSWRLLRSRPGRAGRLDDRRAGDLEPR